MPKKLKKITILIVGIIFILLGLVGLALPFLQGILFLIIGILLISLYFPAVRLKLKKHIERHPHTSSIITKMETWLVKFIGEI